MEWLNYHHLLYFWTVAREGGVSKAAETLRLARQFHAALPAILVTADPNQDLIRRAYQEQVYSVIPKPVSKHVVLYTVVRALGRFYGPEPGSGAG